MDPYFYATLGSFKVRLINGNKYYDSVTQTPSLGYDHFGETFAFTHSSSAA